MPTWDGTQWVPDSPPAGSPSAISGLLALLTANPPSPQQTPGQGPPPNGALPPQGGPSGPPMPVGNMQAPPMPQTPSLNVPNPQTIQSLMQTGQAGLPPSQQHQSFLGSLHDKIQNFLTGSAPSGYDNLLTPDQEKKDQPGIIESLLGGGIFAPLLGRAMYERNLGRNVDMKQLAGQIQATNAARMENARILASRQKMAQLFPQDPNAPLAQQKSQLVGMYNFAVSNGDTEMAKDIGARMNDMFKENAANTGYGVAPAGAAIFDKSTGKFVATNPAEFKHQGTPVTYQSPDGSQYKAFFADETPPAGWKPWAKPSALGGGGGTGFGSGGIGMVARQYAAIAGMQNADTAMKPFEQAVQDGTANYTGLDYYKGAWSKMYDAQGHIDPAVHAAVYAKLNQENPMLANYLSSAEQWALEDSQLSGRPSDFRTKLDAYISAIGPNSQKSTIAQRQSFRGTRLKALGDVLPAMKAMLDRAAGSDAGGGTGIPIPSEGGADGGTTPQSDSGKPDPVTRARQLAAKGYSRAKILSTMKAEGYKVVDSGGGQ